MVAEGPQAGARGCPQAERRQHRPGQAGGMALTTAPDQSQLESAACHLLQGFNFFFFENGTSANMYQL